METAEEMTVIGAYRHIRERLHNATDWQREYEDTRPLEAAAITRLGCLLRPLLPQLHARLKERYQSALAEWIESGPYEQCSVQFETEWRSTEEVAKGLLSDWEVALDVEGYDGWAFDGDDLNALVSPSTLAALDSALAEFRKAVTAERGRLVKALIGLASGTSEAIISKVDQRSAQFIVYGLIDNAGLPEGVGILWLLECDYIKDSEWMVVPDEDFDLLVPKVWDEVRDILPSEVTELMDEAG